MLVIVIEISIECGEAEYTTCVEINANYVNTLFYMIYVFFTLIIL